MKVPVAVSARHAHLSAATLQKLFGEGYELHVRTWLSQTGQFSAQETVSLVGPHGRIDGVRLMGPPRQQDPDRAVAKRRMCSGHCGSAA